MNHAAHDDALYFLTVDFTLKHRNAIRVTLKTHFHKLIGPEIRREMQHAETMKWMGHAEDNDTSMIHD